jgi:protein O-GlcNAc transferase
VKVVSFSLWGDNPKYTVGAIKNCELMNSVYPGWVSRFYIGTSTPLEVVRKLENLGAQVVMMKEPGDWRGMFWRFEAASDPNVDVMLSRDCDSRVNFREAAAVNEWLLSDKQFHIMRDHPWHGTPILGGMWGVKYPFLKNINELMSKYEKGDFWQVDQNFLKLLYPHIKEYCFVHDDFFEKKPWPTPRVGLEFVGQVFDENDNTVQEHLDVLKSRL